jgi:opacity protein-like surface antigen
MKKLLLSATLLAALAAPALAESYNPNLGSGNIVPPPGGRYAYSDGSNYVRAGSARMYAPGYAAYGYAPGYSYYGGHQSCVTEGQPGKPIDYANCY